MREGGREGGKEGGGGREGGLTIPWRVSLLLDSSGIVKGKEKRHR